jgi:hypothetical protein
VAGDWRRLHNEEIYNLYASPNIIRMIISKRIRLARNIAHVGEVRNAYTILVGKPEWKEFLGKYRPRWEDIRLDVRGNCGVDLSG